MARRCTHSTYACPSGGLPARWLSHSIWPRHSIASWCASCHGANFSSPIDPSYPKIAGQHADYLYVALKSYQVDHNPLMGRNNAIMMGMARPFTHPEIKAIAAYLGSLPGELKTVQQPRFR